MRLSTLIQYLMGERQAILEIAACPKVVWVGLVFVISAGFAREYDGEDLFHEPGHALLPLGASLVTSFLLYCLADFGLRARQEESEEEELGFFAGYRRFLGLYWMTAPLAWLYALPAERWFGPADAVAFNLWLLGIVSVWRVALMTRVLSVIFHRSLVRSFFVVMVFADAVAMVVVWLTPLPILSIMGGIRLTDSERLLREVGFLLRIFGILTFPVWLIGVLIAVNYNLPDAPRPEVRRATIYNAKIAWRVWLLAILSIAIWIPILPFTQVEQWNRRFVEKRLRRERVVEAIDYMSQRSRADFPPHWDPPPRLGYGDRKPSLIDVLRAANRPGVASWVQEIFNRKLIEQAESELDRQNYYFHAVRLRDIDDARLARYAEFLATLPKGRVVAAYHEAEIRSALEPESEVGGPDEPTPPLTEERRQSLEAILSLVPPPESHAK